MWCPPWSKSPPNPSSPAPPPTHPPIQTGKYVVPALIEKAIAEAEIASQSLVFGSDKPYNIAIIVPNWDKLRDYGVQHSGGSITINSTPEEIGTSLSHPPTHSYDPPAARPFKVYSSSFERLVLLHPPTHPPTHPLRCQPQGPRLHRGPAHRRVQGQAQEVRDSYPHPSHQGSILRRGIAPPTHPPTHLSISFCYLSTYSSHPFTHPPTHYKQNELLTQKLSIKRHLVVKKYEEQINALYKGDSKVVVA